MNFFSYLGYWFTIVERLFTSRDERPIKMKIKRTNTSRVEITHGILSLLFIFFIIGNKTKDRRTANTTGRITEAIDFSKNPARITAKNKRR